MLKFYLKSAWRNIKKGKLYSVINILGLSIGLATGIMLLLWVQNETGYDQFLKQADQIYQVNTQFKGQKNAGKAVVYPMTPPKVYSAAQSIPAIKTACRVLDNGTTTFLKAGARQPYKLSSMFVDNSFLSVFSYTLKSGNKATLWQSPHSIVMTRRAAQKVFGDRDPLGQLLDYEGTQMTVTGVLADFPSKSTIQTDVLLPMAYYSAAYAISHPGRDMDEDRQNFGLATYLLLQKTASAKNVAAAINKTWTDLGDKRFDFQLQHLTKTHLTAPNGDNSALRLVQIFMAIVVMLFLIASINYVNIATARSLVRAKEVSIKKIIGAKKGQLFIQFVLETILIFGISLVLAIGLIYLLMPLYNYISGKTLHFDLSDLRIWKTLLLVIFGTLLLSSIYPALLLSSFKPLNSLKGKVGKNVSANAFRKALVVFQFFMAAILLSMTMVMGRQMDYIRHKNIGYDKDYVFTVSFPEQAIPHLETIKTDLARNSNIESIGLSNAEDLTDLYVSSTGMKWEGKDPSSTFMIYSVSVDDAFIPTMKMQMTAGKNFSGVPTDSMGLILNQTAISQMGLQPPYVGQQVSFGSKKFTILGIVRDFNFQSLKSAISPLVMYVNPASRNTLYIRTSQRRMAAAIKAAEAAYQPYKTNEQPFKYAFIDKQFEALYKADLRVGTLFTSFASIAIFISCLGLFGLATYNAEARIKEIGIRKVLGADVRSIIGLICKDFLLLVILAILISAPLSYLLADKWLHNFAFKTHIGVGIFVQVLCVLVLITFITMALNVYKTAKSNLLPHLKSE